MEIDKALISKLEKLAQLELSAQEADALQTDLVAMLEMIEKMEDLDTTGIEPLTRITDVVNHFRPDQAGTALTAGDALKNAPEHQGDFFRVPKVIHQKNQTD